jgi:hypothetical protein
MQQIHKIAKEQSVAKWLWFSLHDGCSLRPGYLPDTDCSLEDSSLVVRKDLVRVPLHIHQCQYVPRVETRFC